MVFTNDDISLIKQFEDILRNTKELESAIEYAENIDFADTEKSGF